MHELMIQAGVKGMSERSELIPCNDNNTLITYVKQNYRIARNFRGLKFSRMSLARTFRDLIFEDCVRAQRRLTAGKILEDKISSYMV